MRGRLVLAGANGVSGVDGGGEGLNETKGQLTQD